MTVIVRGFASYPRARRTSAFRARTRSTQAGESYVAESSSVSWAAAVPSSSSGSAKEERARK
ncbi:hypothetical protein OHA74_40220 [Streptomyces phaeochromogenes]|uniref:hypothetical protein n=1 Tax=Streptomyces phaeochromogenes TaxID=1923 RepID=UPI002E2D6541|nr:hypothetical protein [Streptomyces phaeochromogenes]